MMHGGIDLHSNNSVVTVIDDAGLDMPIARNTRAPCSIRRP